jgi:predicted transcriptional regulator
LQNLNYRSIQIGLTGDAVQHYVNDWIVAIDDITPLCKQIHSLVLDKKIEEAKALLPLENIYPITDDLRKIIGHS